MVHALEAEGVEVVFGYPGGAALPLFDAMVDAKMKFVLVRHEQGATHMADGYARASGKVGVVLVTSGPGATNTITGLYTAYADSVPLVVISGQVSTAMLGKDAFQEADVSALTLPVVKNSYLVTEARDLPRVVREAFFVARTGRPGPVVIDIPKDVASASVDFPLTDVDMDLPGYSVPGACDARALRQAAELLHRAKRPLLLVGQGALIAGAHDEVRLLAEKLQAPVTTTLLGKGAFPETHGLALGMLGMHGTAYANKAVTRADVIFSIGSRFDDRIVGRYDSFGRRAKIIHLDIDAAEHGKVIRPEVSLVGDARRVLEDLLVCVEPGDTWDWLAEVEDLKQVFPLHACGSGALTAAFVLQRLYDLTLGQAVVTTDVGQHQMWAAQFYKTCQARSWISSGGAGTMGFGFPAALGAQVARPEKTVIAVVGDGGFQMTQAELATAVTQRLPVKILILDNGYLGMVRQWQEMFFDNRLSGVQLSGNPDFVRLAEAYGAKGYRITQIEHLDEQLEAALADNSGPCVIHCKVLQEENVYPMIPTGKALEEMIVSEPKEAL